MEGSIIFYTYGSTLELNGQQFEAGRLTEDLLNLSPDDYHPLHERMVRIRTLSLPDSTVEIAGRIEAGKIVLTFSNAGKNIPQEKLDRIFEQFFRLDSSRATRTGGAGLGLAIAKEIVELHGGTIRADSTEDRITFTICLPSDHSEAP